MLVVKINSNEIKKNVENIEIDSYKVIRSNEKNVYVKFISNSFLGFNENDEITITNDDGEKIILKVKEISSDNKSFCLEIPSYSKIVMKNYYKNDEEIYFNLDYPLPYRFKEEDTINIKFIDYKGNVNMINGFKVIDSLYIKTNNNDAINRFENETAYIVDDRFINSDKLKENLKYSLSRINLSFQIPLEEDISLDLNMEDNIRKIYKSKIEDIIPEIIDFEKKQFIPCYINDEGNMIEAEKIKINLFFRDREGSDNWVSDDTRGWNQKDVDEITPKIYVKDGDLIGHLGFTDDDVYYQKSKLLKSFVRLSYFDSKEMGKQMLLNYSTVFMDTGKMYENYVNLIKYKNDPSRVNMEIVKEMDNDNFPIKVTADERICSSFTIFDDNNKSKSSEGFYIYLYDTVLNGYKDENGFSDIYMKIEFNHAKYGRTIPFILPYDKNGKPLHFYSSNFPTSYMKKNENGNMVIDMKKFYNDTYIHIKCKFNEKNGKYVYYFPNTGYNEEDNSIIINAFEPRINDIS